MKKLTDILKNTPVREVCGDTAAAIGGLVYDSRAVKPGDCFFAVPGTQSDGHDYIPIAVEKGAAAIVCERMPADAAEGVAYVLVGDSAGAMADMAAAFYDYPSRELKLVGITGTNGKTTTATLLYDLVRAMGYKAGLISTVVYKIDGREVEATHTTPDSIRLNAMMREMADAGCAYCFMECSSHAIVQERTRGLDFAGGIFSNITHDHLDYHKTFAEYIRAKKLFFDGLPKGAFALTNADDRNGRVMVQNTAAAVSAYSLRAMADFRCKIVEMHLDGMLLRIDGQELWVGLLGRFNAYNLLAVYGAAVLPLLERLDWSGSARWKKQLMDDVRLQAAYYPRFLEPRLAPGEALTPTELQILHLICADKSNAEIGQIMDIKLPTVKTHVSHILDKLDVRRRSEAKTAAKRLRLIPEER